MGLSLPLQTSPRNREYGLNYYTQSESYQLRHANRNRFPLPIYTAHPGQAIGRAGILSAVAPQTVRLPIRRVSHRSNTRSTILLPPPQPDSLNRIAENALLTTRTTSALVANAAARIGAMRTRFGQLEERDAAIVEQQRPSVR